MKKSIILKYGIYAMLILFISFVLPRIIPGSPLSYDQNDTYILHQSLPESTFNAFKEYYAPEESLPKQFGIYIKNLLNFDLGYSFYYKLPVIDLIKSRLPWTILLGVSSLLISTFIAIKLGIKTAMNEKRSKLKMGMAIGVQALPSFLVAVLIQGLLGYKLKIFPTWGAYTIGIEFFTFEFYMDVLNHMALPLLTLIICEIPGIYMLSYNSTKKIKSENYIVMAKYLNIHQDDINKNYIFKNITPEILGKLNIQVVYAITGSLFVEAIFSYPGLGQLLKNSTTSRDFPLIQGLLLMVCFYGLIVNAIFEIAVKKNSEKY